MSLLALLTTHTIPVIKWNSIDNVLVYNVLETTCTCMLLNNDLIPREGFLSLNKLLTVVCFQQVLRLFMSTSLQRFCAFLYVDICAFAFVFLYFMLFYVDIDRSTGLLFHAFLRRQVLRLFMWTGLRVFALFYVDICVFPCLHVGTFIDGRPRIQNITVDCIFCYKQATTPDRTGQCSVYFEGLGGCHP